MSPATLFKVYMAVVMRREYTRENRGHSLGIGVAYDTYAREWQRLHRLASKLETRLLHDLLMNEINSKPGKGHTGYGTT